MGAGGPQRGAEGAQRGAGGPDGMLGGSGVLVRVLGSAGGPGVSWWGDLGGGSVGLAARTGSCRHVSWVLLPSRCPPVAVLALPGPPGVRGGQRPRGVLHGPAPPQGTGVWDGGSGCCWAGVCPPERGLSAFPGVSLLPAGKWPLLSLRDEFQGFLISGQRLQLKDNKALAAKHLSGAPAPPWGHPASVPPAQHRDPPPPGTLLSPPVGVVGGLWGGR